MVHGVPMLHDAPMLCAKEGLRVREDKLGVWSTTLSGPVHIGKHKMKPEACIDFLGTLLFGDRSRAAWPH